MEGIKSLFSGVITFSSGVSRDTGETLCAIRADIQGMVLVIIPGGAAAECDLVRVR